MVTVPAHSFSAPTRAKLMAAARFMPGVCAVFGSSDEAGMTLTPWRRQFFASVSLLIALHPHRFKDRSFLREEPARARQRCQLERRPPSSCQPQGECNDDGQYPVRQT